ncbi:MAG: NAD(P)-binding domain-containing protein [Candidatus Tumulicola sp.]
MKIGILGTDSRALAIGRLLAEGGHQLSFSNPRDAAAAERAAAQLGALAETPYNQAMARELMVFACSRNDIDAAIASIGSPVEGVVLDALDGPPRAPHQGAELLARKLDSHEVVRGLIVLPQAGANVPICGDDPVAKALVDEAFRASGCLTTDRGPLSHAVELEPSSPAIAA